MNCLEAGAGVAPVAVSEVPAQAYPLGRWTLLKHPFVKRSKPAVPAAPVQGELLLDLVRPMRNDLSDSDLEIVPAAARAGGTSGLEPELPAPPVLPAAEAEAPMGNRSELTLPRRGVTPVSAVDPVSVEPRASRPALSTVEGPAVSCSEPAAWDRVNEQFFGTGHS